MNIVEVKIDADSIQHLTPIPELLLSGTHQRQIVTAYRGVCQALLSLCIRESVVVILALGDVARSFFAARWLLQTPEVISRRGVKRRRSIRG